MSIRIVVPGGNNVPGGNITITQVEAPAIEIGNVGQVLAIASSDPPELEWIAAGGGAVIKWTPDLTWDADIKPKLTALGNKATVYVYNDPAQNTFANNGAPLHVTSSHDLTAVNFVGIAQGEYGTAYIAIDAGVNIGAGGFTNLNASDLQIDFYGAVSTPGDLVLVSARNCSLARQADVSVFPGVAEAEVLFYNFSGVLALVSVTTAFFDIAANGFLSVQAQGGSTVDASTYGGAAGSLVSVFYTPDSQLCASTAALLSGTLATYSGNSVLGRGVALAQFTTSQLASGADANNTGKLVYDKTLGVPKYSNGSAFVAVGGVSGSGASSQIAYWNGASSLTGSPDVTTDGTNLTFGHATAQSNPIISPAQLTVSANASTLTVRGSKGLDGAGNVSTSVGGPLLLAGGKGGNGATGVQAGSGANATLIGGSAGNVNGGSGAATSGSAVIDAGALNGGLAAGDVSIGATNASAVVLGSATAPTTTQALTVAGAFAVNATSTFNGSVNLGDTSGRLIAVVGSISTNVLMTKGAQGISQGAANTDSNGGTLSWTAGAGGAAFSTGGGTGATASVSAGVGGAGTGALNPGNGAPLTLNSGAGGTGGTGNSNSGNILLDTGAARGTGTPGTIGIGITAGGPVSLGRAGQPVSIFGGHVLGYANITAASATVTLGQTVVGVNRAGPVALTLPANTAGLVVVVKDESNAAGTNNITITPASGTVDGASSKVINTNLGSFRFYGNGTNWFTW